MIIVFLWLEETDFSEKRDGNFLMKTDHANTISSIQENILGETIDN